jgi:hypothetical protein
MPMHYAIRLVAGTFVLGSLALGWFVNPLWFLFTAFVGLNLIQSAFTRWCLMEKILSGLGLAQPEPPTPAMPPAPRRMA